MQAVEGAAEIGDVRLTGRTRSPMSAMSRPSRRSRRRSRRAPCSWWRSGRPRRAAGPGPVLSSSTVVHRARRSSTPPFFTTIPRRGDDQDGHRAGHTRPRLPFTWEPRILASSPGGTRWPRRTGHGCSSRNTRWFRRSPGRHSQAGRPSGSTAAGGRPDRAGLVAAAHEQPGDQRVRVPHLARTQLIAAPGDGGEGGHQVHWLGCHDQPLLLSVRPPAGWTR